MMSANWAAGENSFADNPPNAVLSFAEPGDRLPEDTVVVIQDPHLDGDALTYSIQLLDGTVPAATGPCALFIDPSGVPCHRSLQPGCTGVSAAGCAEDTKALPGRETLLVPEGAARIEPSLICMSCGQWPGVRWAGLPEAEPAADAGPAVPRSGAALEYARHGRSVGGESPLEEEVMLTPGRRQLRRREARWERKPEVKPCTGEHGPRRRRGDLGEPAQEGKALTVDEIAT